MKVPPQERVPIAEVRDLIAIGVTLPFSVLDAQERLLLNEGQVIGGERQMQLLADRGAWVDRKLVEQRRGAAAGGAAAGTARAGGKWQVERVATLFDRWERALWDLDAVLRATLKGEAVPADWTTLADGLMRLVDRDVDIALFQAVRQEDRRFVLYPLAHSLHAAVLALLTARQAGWPPERQLTVVGAALSMNVAMIDLQAQMVEQDSAPTQRQLEAIRAHTLKGVQLLQAVGVTDFDWLRAVAEHHERADGSGYPRRLSEVCDEARVLSMADVYMAKITPRAKRPSLPPVVASRQLFQQEPGSPLAMALIKAIGVHPPGSLVQLKSGQVAIVKQRPAGSPSPLALTLSDRKGVPSPHSQTVNTAEPEYAIVGPCTDASPFARVPAERIYGIVPA